MAHAENAVEAEDVVVRSLVATADELATIWPL
jgi:hypothetical protein